MDAADHPYTPAELDVAIKVGCWPHQVRAVLDAVLPDHDARVRANERARVAEEIAQALLLRDRAEWALASQYAGNDAAHIARAHATTEEDHHAA